MMGVNDAIEDEEIQRAIRASLNPIVKIYGTHEQIEAFLDYVEFNIEMLEDMVQTSSYANIELN